MVPRQRRRLKQRSMLGQELELCLEEPEPFQGSEGWQEPGLQPLQPKQQPKQPSTGLQEVWCLGCQALAGEFSQVLGCLVLWCQVLECQALGSLVLESQVLESQVLESQGPCHQLQLLRLLPRQPNMVAEAA